LRILVDGSSSWSPEGGDVREAVRGLFRSILGETGTSVFEFNLTRILGRDPFELFYEDPPLFYEGLKKMFTAGADAILRLIGNVLINGSGLTNVTIEDFLNFMERGDPEAKAKLREMLLEFDRRKLRSGID